MKTFLVLTYLPTYIAKTKNHCVVNLKVALDTSMTRVMYISNIYLMDVHDLDMRFICGKY